MTKWEKRALNHIHSKTGIVIHWGDTGAAALAYKNLWIRVPHYRDIISFYWPIKDRLDAKWLLLRNFEHANS